MNIQNIVQNIVYTNIKLALLANKKYEHYHC